MSLQCFHFPGNITMFLPPDWFTRPESPVDVNECKSEQFDIAAYPHRPDIVDERLTAFLDGVPLDDDRKAFLGIAVSEVAMNAMTHDGLDPTRMIRVHFLYVAPRFVLVGIMDTLGPIPEAAFTTDPTNAEAMEKLPDHGRGFFIIKQIVNILGQCPDSDCVTKEIWVGVDLQTEVHHEKVSATSS